jgi:hypothetical protein
MQGEITQLKGQAVEPVDSQEVSPETSSQEFHKTVEILKQQLHEKENELEVLSVCSLTCKIT